MRNTNAGVFRITIRCDYDKKRDTTMIWNIIAKYDASKNPPNMFRFLGSIAYTVQTLGY